MEIDGPSAAHGDGHPRQLAGNAEGYQGVGVNEVHVMPGTDPVGFIRQLGEHVVPRLHEPV